MIVSMLAVGGGALLVWLGISDPPGGLAAVWQALKAGESIETSATRAAVRRQATLQLVTHTGSGTDTSGGGGGTVSGPLAARIVGAARAYLGVPYYYSGASRERGIDCSGLVFLAHRDAGLKVKRLAAAGYQVSRQWRDIPAADAAPGDLVFYGFPAHHVGIITGPGVMVHAPRRGRVVTDGVPITQVSGVRMFRRWRATTTAPKDAPA